MSESLEERLSRSSARILSLASLFTPLLSRHSEKNLIDATVLKAFFHDNAFEPRELLFIINFAVQAEAPSFDKLRIAAGRNLLKLSTFGQTDYGFFVLETVPEIANLAARRLLRNPDLTTDDLTFIIERSLKYRVAAANRLLTLQHTIEHLKLIVMEVPELRYQVLDKLLTATDDEEAQLLVIRLHPEPRVREKAWETVNYQGKFKSTAEEVHQKLKMTNSEYVFIE